MFKMHVLMFKKLRATLMYFLRRPGDLGYLGSRSCHVTHVTSSRTTGHALKIIPCFFRAIWWLPKMGVPKKHQYFDRDSFPSKPSSVFGVPPIAMETTISILAEKVAMFDPSLSTQIHR